MPAIDEVAVQMEWSPAPQPPLRERRSWRSSIRWFAAEFLVIVTGVLVALGLNALYQRAQDMRNEQTYLALLTRDIEHTVRQLEEKAAFESAQVNAGLMAYRALSAVPRPEDRPAISASLSRLVDRRTLVLREATYQDLLSTGNLRLIRNRELRNRIVDFYETTRGEYDIMNRNNSHFVDELYLSAVVGKGLVKPGLASGNSPMIVAAQAKLTPMLRPGYIDEPDYLWSLPPSAPDWAVLRATLLARIRMAALSDEFARQILTRTRALASELQASS